MSVSKKENILPMVGRIEKIDLLDFEIFSVDAKIDTGAYSSSIHCDEMTEKDGELTIYLNNFTGHGETKILKTKDYKLTSVRSSNGHIQRRYKIRTHLKIGDSIIHTDFTLANRDSMKFPVLLGRKAIKKLFLVDVSRTYLLSK